MYGSPGRAATTVNTDRKGFGGVRTGPEQNLKWIGRRTCRRPQGIQSFSDGNQGSTQRDDAVSGKSNHRSHHSGPERRRIRSDWSWRTIPEGMATAVIVVDNGSTDRTGAVAAEGGAVVVREPRRGYGAACLRGMAEAARFAPDFIVFLDGDYSDYPEDMADLVRPITEEGYDMVIGSRMLGHRAPGAMPVQALIGNVLVPRIIRWLYGHRYTDLGPFGPYATTGCSRKWRTETSAGPSKCRSRRRKGSTAPSTSRCGTGSGSGFPRSRERCPGRSGRV